MEIFFFLQKQMAEMTATSPQASQKRVSPLSDSMGAEVFFLVAVLLKLCL